MKKNNNSKHSTAVKPKKHLGQHFLNDVEIARKIAGIFGERVPEVDVILEIGPGMGVLTGYLNEFYGDKVHLAEIDPESVTYLNEHFPTLKEKIYEEDFLKMNLSDKFNGKLAVIGNFPYNISSQIVFKVMENRSLVSHFGGMFQKEVAERLTAKRRTKAYGILSVLLPAFFDVTYLFTVDEHVFIPPPKVKSGVIKAIRKENYVLGCDEKLFFEVVKTSFGMRRKMLNNSLGKFNVPKEAMDTNEFSKLRAEELGVEEFVKLTNFIAENRR
ncbi:MAG: 16S rRNA (adenine(1518)-N(6)/adenine(1519)-N(6))-dimethyltransferase RsmA [Bacteroidia bacterium]|nr:16S rRNA (adenine(1518)-N(6)/adenine(1519)-N(6))-dimethyltransferase RsmA [Bacteroidia bacterium]